jgi:hypothetical protein
MNDAAEKLIVALHISRNASSVYTWVTVLPSSEVLDEWAAPESGIEACLTAASASLADNCVVLIWYRGVPIRSWPSNDLQERVAVVAEIIVAESQALLND